MKVRRRKRSAPEGSSSGSFLPILAIGAVAYLLFSKKGGAVGSPLPFSTEPSYFLDLYYPKTDWTTPSGGYDIPAGGYNPSGVYQIDPIYRDINDNWEQYMSQGNWYDSYTTTPWTTIH